METPSQRFVKVANRRTKQLLNTIRLLANLKSSNYKSTSKQTDYIIRTARKAIDDLEAVYAGQKIVQDPFDLIEAGLGPIDEVI